MLNKTETQQLQDKIVKLENIIEDKNNEIRDLKSSFFDLNDTNLKISKKMKDYKKKISKLRSQLIDLKCKLKEVYQSKGNDKLKRLKEIIQDINDENYSDDEVRSVSILTLSDAGSIYYPNKAKTKCPFNKPDDKNTAKKIIGYHRKTKSKNLDSDDSSNIQKIQFNIEDVFLPTESYNPNQFSDLKTAKGNFELSNAKKIDFAKLHFSSEDEDENNEPNVLYRSPVKCRYRDSVIRMSNLRQSNQISEIFANSSKNWESPMRASDVFSRRDNLEVLRSCDFNS